jgi:nucleoside-diphosphate-sugar epimerase
MTTTRENPVRDSVLILGANGRLGSAAVAAFLAAGWRVKALVRGAFAEAAVIIADSADEGALEVVSADALAPDAILAAAQGVSVIVNALNVPFGDWARDTPRLTDAVTRAAAKTGATVLLAGNVYHYGASMPAKLSELSPAKPSDKLGEVRLEMEKIYGRRAPLEGFQVLNVRAGDFFGPARSKASGGWFDSHIAAKIQQGKLSYPGPLDVLHTWAYLPDLSRAMVALAQHRAALSQVETVGFPGYHLTGAELIGALENMLERRLRIRRTPWRLIRVASIFSANLRGVLQTEYLWRTPHAIDAEKFHKLLPDFVATPLATALACATQSTPTRHKSSTP